MSELLHTFREEMKRRNVRLHGAVIMSGGKIVEQTYCGRYTADTLTRMYSTTKSVAAIAIGKLVLEGKLSLDDRVVDIFADRFDMSDVHPYLREQTVRQMLLMTTCLSEPAYDENCRDWLAAYFRAKPTHPAGTVWNYDSSGSYVIGAITKHITGLDFVEYLRPEFDIMGVGAGVYCLRGPDGEAWASSGFMATTADLAKIAYMLMSGGRWCGKQLIPEDFARDAISPLVSNNDRGIASRFDCGYGYQIWSHPGGAFAFRGLGGQIAIGYPERDLVFACNSDTSNNHNAYDDIFDAVEQILLPAYPKKEKPIHAGIKENPVKTTVFEKIKNTTYSIDENPIGIETVRLGGDENRIELYYTRRGVDYRLDFSVGEETRFVFPEKYSGVELFCEKEFINYNCTAIAEWLEPGKLYIRIYAEDLFVGNMALCFAFRDNLIGVKAVKSAQFFFDDFRGFAGGRAKS